MTRILLLLFLCCGLSPAFSQNDAVKIAEAKIAIEKKGDYAAALSALREVSIVGRSNPLFIYYTAISFDKLAKFDSAAHYYNKYIQLYPNNAQLIERVAELNYEIRKVNELKEGSKNLTGTWKSRDALYVPENRFGTMSVAIVQQGNEVTIKGAHTGFTYFKGLRTGDTVKGKAYVYTDHNFRNKEYTFPNHTISMPMSTTSSIDGIKRNTARDDDPMFYFTEVDATGYLRHSTGLDIEHKQIVFDKANHKLVAGSENILYLQLTRQ